MKFPGLRFLERQALRTNPVRELRVAKKMRRRENPLPNTVHAISFASEAFDAPLASRNWLRRFSLQPLAFSI